MIGVGHSLTANPLADPGRWRGRRGWVERRWWVDAVLIAVCACVLVPGLFSLPPVDRDESRFAQASWQMFTSGDYIVPMVQDRPRLNKPPLIYWLQCGSLWVFGDRSDAHGPRGGAAGEFDPTGGIWVYRVPSAVCMVLSVVLTWRLGRRLMDPRAAALGALLLAVSPLVVWDAHQARADQLLLVTVLITMTGLERVWAMRGRAGGPGWVWPVVLWVGVGLGILSKGPVTPMVAALAAIALSVLVRDVRWLGRTRPVLGVLIVGAIVGPWVGGVVSRVGLGAYAQQVYDETLGRSGEAKEGHWGPPGYHAVMLVVLLWPGVLMTLAGIVDAWRRGVRRLRFGFGLARDADAFLLAWALPTWIVFELIATKLPHYAMPAYPALALLGARAVMGASARASRVPTGWRRVLMLGPWVLVGVAMVVGVPLALVGLGVDAGVLTWLLGVGTVVGLFAALWMLVAARPLAGSRWTLVQLAGVVALVPALALVLEGLLPRSRELWVSSRLWAQVCRLDPAGERAIGLVGYHEDSMIFLSRGRAVRLDAPALGEFVTSRPGALVAIQAPGWSELPREVKTQLDLVTSVRGVNYSTGKKVTVELYQRRR